MSLSAGRLRHRVKLQRPVFQQDTLTGAMNKTWQDVSSVWAAIEPHSVKEFIASQTEESKVSCRIVIRYRDDVDYSWRVFYPRKNQYFNIEGVLSDKDSGLEYLTLPCSEGLRD